MTKVAFWFDRPQAYSGGLNYLRNLLFALSRVPERNIRPYIFFGKRVDDDVVRTFEPLATVVRTSILDRKSVAWFAHRILQTFFGSLLMIELAIRRHGISIVSHADRVHAKRRRFRIISWIPDFQYLHLPELFPRNVDDESRRLLAIAEQTDALVLSSDAALADFQRIAGAGAKCNVTVLPFVSQPSIAISEAGQVRTLAAIEAKYAFSGRYFFLPNQFWQHKNHAVVFKAVKRLKEHGLDVVLICTGNLRDYRVTSMSYSDELLGFVAAQGLEQEIRILGMVDYGDVLFLMRHCLAVINPSRFEGWSSTVEEARSLCKPLILSDIAVHREQDPQRAMFFAPDDEATLADLMSKAWTGAPHVVGVEEEERAARDLAQRTAAFAAKYERLVQSL